MSWKHSTDLFKNLYMLYRNQRNTTLKKNKVKHSNSAESLLYSIVSAHHTYNAQTLKDKILIVL